MLRILNEMELANIWAAQTTISAPIVEKYGAVATAQRDLDQVELGKALAERDLAISMVAGKEVAIGDIKSLLTMWKDKATALEAENDRLRKALEG